jgi:hypothetical protein
MVLFFPVVFREVLKFSLHIQRIHGFMGCMQEWIMEGVVKTVTGVAPAVAAVYKYRRGTLPSAI